VTRGEVKKAICSFEGEYRRRQEKEEKTIFEKGNSEQTLAYQE